MLGNPGQLLMGFTPKYFSKQHHFKNKVAIVDEEREVTWSELNQRVNKLANALLAYGIKKGDKLAVLMTARVEYVEIIYALCKIGAVIVPLNYRYVARELEFTINFSDACKIFVSPEVVPKLREAYEGLDIISPKDTIVVGKEIPDDMVSFEALLASGDEKEPDVEVLETDPFWISFTGGTTGLPKAAVCRHRSLVQMYLYLSVEFGMTNKEVLLAAGPFYHGLSFAFGVGSLFFGGTLVLHKEFNPTEVLKTIEEKKITMIALVPTMFNMILNLPAKDKYDTSSLRMLVSGGAPLMTSTKEGIVKYFRSAHIAEYFGATEGSIFTVLHHDDVLRKHRSCGEPCFGMEIKLLDENFQEVPRGDVGEFWKRGQHQSGEYYKNQKATDEIWHDGWIRSGDMGWQDEEGFYYIVDRKKDMIIRGGVNIFPSEIEDIISSHEAVEECAVVGAPDEYWGEIIVAVVSKKANVAISDEQLEAELTALCKKNLTAYKKPVAYHFWKELPKSGPGKILRREVRKYFWEDKREQV